MTYLIAAYLFLSVSSGIAMVQSNTWTDWIASMIAGFLWPFILTSRIIRKLDSLLE